MHFCKSKVSKVEFKRRIKKHIAKNERLKFENSILQEKNATLQSQNLALQESASLQRNEALSAENNSLNFQHQLIAKLLSDKEPNADLDRFRKLLNEDFMDFANQDDSLANEAEILLKLQNIEKELVIASTCPQIYNKAIIAVAGTFSSGKSTFISSFFDDIKISLPQALEPSTAISTFVINETKCELLGVSNEGVEVNLSALDKEIHSKLAHEFIEKFGFKLKKLMPFMVFQIALDDELKHLCFIDTPGINAPDKGFTSNDEKNAKEFLDDADALIWVVRLKSGGISDDDLRFLNGLDLSQKKLFIVLNRADDLPPQQHKNIIELTTETLDNHCIEFEGISAYSSLERKEYLFEKMSLKEFLHTFEPKQNLQKKFLAQLNELFQAYETAILEKHKKRKEIKGKLHSFELELLNSAFDDENIFCKLNRIKRYFDDKKEDSSLETLEKIINQMKDTINAIFGKHLDIPLPNSMQKTKKHKG